MQTDFSCPQSSDFVEIISRSYLQLA